MRHLWLLLLLLLAGISIPAEAAAHSGATETCTSCQEKQGDLSPDEPLTPVVIDAGSFCNGRFLSQQRHSASATETQHAVFFRPEFFFLSHIAQHQQFPLRKHLLYCILRC